MNLTCFAVFSEKFGISAKRRLEVEFLITTSDCSLFYFQAGETTTRQETRTCCMRQLAWCVCVCVVNRTTAVRSHFSVWCL